MFGIATASSAASIPSLSGLAIWREDPFLLPRVSERQKRLGFTGESMSRRFTGRDSRRAEKGGSGQPLGKVRFRGDFEVKTEVVILGFILGLAFSVTFGFCNRLVLSDLEKLERVKGIEPSWLLPKEIHGETP